MKNDNAISDHICSLDAESAFDGIPHSILFHKAIGTIPYIYWRLLVHWYEKLVVHIKWNNEISDVIIICKGTRQGGLSSPFLFNLLYQDMVKEISNMSVGISINNVNYNAFCYADDILLCSLSITGLQKLINKANEEIQICGLNFNANKTQCITLGKCNYAQRRWYLDNVCLKETDYITYLGVVLSNNDAKHCETRIAATRRAFYALQNVGMCARGVKPETVTHIYNTAIRPVLMYGLHCVNNSKSVLQKAEKLQSKLLKSSIGLKVYSKNTPLLDALKIPRIKSTIQLQEMSLLRTMILSSSHSQNFYKYMLSLHMNGTPVSQKCLVARVAQTCAHNKLSLVNTICDKSYTQRHKSRFTTYKSDGLIDSIRYLLRNFNQESLVTLQLLLSPF